LLGTPGPRALGALLRRDAVATAFDLRAELTRVLDLMDKYRDVPMSLADASLVRMTERFPDSTLLTTDDDFRIYRRHGRQVVPCSMP
jgi:predicted nucleic acid-binding protein